VNAGRALEIARQDLMHNLRRPMFWINILILGLFMAELSGGHASIGSGDARVGGTKAWINSEFANAQLLVLLFAAMYVFFISVGAGMSLIRDDELKVGEVLHSTRLTPGEYVWGKYLAVLVSFAGVMVAQFLLQMFFNHVVPHGANAEYIGPFSLGAYLRPALIFGVPQLVLFTGACFAIGALTRQPVLVFAFPIAVLVLGISFLWDWSPAWLSPGLNRLLEFADLTGYRWLRETYLDVDRGVQFYNHARIALDPLILIQRLLAVAIGLATVWLVQLRFAARLRGARVARREAARVAAAPDPTLTRPEPALLAALRMRSGVPGFVSGTLQVAVTELKLLGRHPGLYLFVPLILIQIFGGLINVGAFDTPLLQTSGILAVSNMNTLTLLISMLILFYNTESLQREGSTAIGSIAYSTPIATGALLMGKAFANALLGAAIVVAALIGCAVVLAIQGQVAFHLAPFVIAWGLLLMPTFLLWTSFVSAVFAITNSRYATYAIGIGAMSLTGWFQLRGKMNWVANWDLWNATRWTDIAFFQYDGLALLLNRVLALGATAFFIVVTVRAFARRERDATRNLQRLRPTSLGRAFVSLAPWLVVPLAAGLALGVQVSNGWQGGAAKKKEHDYWRKITLTYRDVPLPSIVFADADVAIEPRRHWVKSAGTYTLVNRLGAPLETIPLSTGLQWKKTTWKLDGRATEPENRAGLEVFHLARPLAPGDSVRVTWSFEAAEPNGISKNGGAEMEFILPASVVLTGFGSANLAPILGYDPNTGIEEEKNRADPREYSDDFYKGITPAGIPMAESWFDTHLKVTVPADFQVNATGVCVGDTIRGGRRVTEWKSDHPVRIWNVVAGRWKVKRGEGVAVYYDPQHPYNVDEMLEALKGARRWYGEWFAPFPWRELRLSEFAGLATYAQGSPGNITFSENIGFLTRSKPEANAAFWITAHESAHQWWPNIAMAGQGPGGEVLSEGMAHFSTILLTEQVKGVEQRMAFCKQIEDRYGHTRRRDSERPLVKVNGELPGDSRIVYDKGGWALWMLFRSMGRENGLAAQREYLETYRDSRDHPVLQDYLAVMRRHAPDTTAFDGFVKQWFYSVVTPQYQIIDPVLARDGAGWEVKATVKNVGTGTMPVEVAAARGERFPHGKKSRRDYRDARATITLGAGEARLITIRCAFEPEHVLVDPDVLVLQLERKRADVRLHAPPSAGAQTVRRMTAPGRRG
jgi:hypothetical protein